MKTNSRAVVKRIGHVLWVILLVAGWPALLTGAAGQTSSARGELRVMTYNIHHGEGTDGRVDLARIAQVILSEKADLVALQEVDQGVQRTQRRDFPAELAALTHMTCLFSNNFHYQGGRYGNAILTRFSVQRWTNTHYQMLRTNEQRGFLQAVVEINRQPVVFISTHLDYRPDETERLQNVRELIALPQRYPGLPIILAGDFNARPESQTHQKIRETYIDVWEKVGEGKGFTITSTQPRERIDYIWLDRQAKLRPLRMRVVASTASDHLPVVAEFTLN